MRYFWIIFNLIVTAIFIVVLTDTIRSQFNNRSTGGVEYDNSAVETPSRPETPEHRSDQQPVSSPRSEEEIAAIEEELAAAAQAAGVLESVTIIDKRGKKLSDEAAAFYLLSETQSDRPNFSVHIPIRPESLLREGEALPNDDLIELFLEFRTRPIAEAHCDLLPADLATDCSFEDHSLVHWRGKEDFATLSIQSTMKMVNGNPDPLPEGETLLLTEGRTTIESEPFLANELTDLSEHIKALLMRHDEVCAIVREAYGNCRITGAAVDVKTVNSRTQESNSSWRPVSTIKALLQYAYFQPVVTSN